MKKRGRKRKDESDTTNEPADASEGKHEDKSDKEETADEKEDPSTSTEESAKEADGDDAGSETKNDDSADNDEKSSPKSGNSTNRSKDEKKRDGGKRPSRTAAVMAQAISEAQQEYESTEPVLPPPYPVYPPTPGASRTPRLSKRTQAIMPELEEMHQASLDIALKVGTTPNYPGEGCFEEVLTGVSSVPPLNWCHEQMLPGISDPTKHRIEASLQTMLNHIRQDYLALIDRVRSPQYSATVRTQVTAEQDKRDQLMAYKKQLEIQIKDLVEDGLTMLKATLRKLEIDAETPTDLIKRANQIVLEHNELQKRSRQLRKEVKQLEEEQEQLAKTKERELLDQLREKYRGRATEPELRIWVKREIDACFRPGIGGEQRQNGGVPSHAAEQLHGHATVGRQSASHDTGPSPGGQRKCCSDPPSSRSDAKSGRLSPKECYSVKDHIGNCIEDHFKVAASGSGGMSGGTGTVCGGSSGKVTDLRKIRPVKRKDTATSGPVSGPSGANSTSTPPTSSSTALSSSSTITGGGSAVPPIKPEPTPGSSGRTTENSSPVIMKGQPATLFLDAGKERTASPNGRRPHQETKPDDLRTEVLPAEAKEESRSNRPQPVLTTLPPKQAVLVGGSGSSGSPNVPAMARMSQIIEDSLRPTETESSTNIYSINKPGSMRDDASGPGKGHVWTEKVPTISPDASGGGPGPSCRPRSRNAGSRSGISDNRPPSRPTSGEVRPLSRPTSAGSKRSLNTPDIFMEMEPSKKRAYSPADSQGHHQRLEDKSRWQDEISSGFDRLLALANQVDRRKHVEPTDLETLYFREKRLRTPDGGGFSGPVGPEVPLGPKPLDANWMVGTGGGDGGPHTGMSGKRGMPYGPAVPDVPPGSPYMQQGDGYFGEPDIRPGDPNQPMSISSGHNNSGQPINGGAGHGSHSQPISGGHSQPISVGADVRLTHSTGHMNPGSDIRLVPAAGAPPGVVPDIRLAHGSSAHHHPQHHYDARIGMAPDIRMVHTVGGDMRHPVVAAAPHQPVPDIRMTHVAATSHQDTMRMSGGHHHQQQLQDSRMNAGANRSDLSNRATHTSIHPTAVGPDVRLGHGGQMTGGGLDIRLVHVTSGAMEMRPGQQALPPSSSSNPDFARISRAECEPPVCYAKTGAAFPPQPAHQPPDPRSSRGLNNTGGLYPDVEVRSLPAHLAHLPPTTETAGGQHVAVTGHVPQHHHMPAGAGPPQSHHGSGGPYKPADYPSGSVTDYTSSGKLPASGRHLPPSARPPSISHDGREAVEPGQLAVTGFSHMQVKSELPSRHHSPCPPQYSGSSGRSGYGNARPDYYPTCDMPPSYHPTSADLNKMSSRGGGPSYYSHQHASVGPGDPSLGGGLRGSKRVGGEVASSPTEFRQHLHQEQFAERGSSRPADDRPDGQQQQQQLRYPGADTRSLDGVGQHRYSSAKESQQHRYPVVHHAGKGRPEPSDVSMSRVERSSSSHPPGAVDLCYMPDSSAYPPPGGQSQKQEQPHGYLSHSRYPPQGEGGPRPGMDATQYEASVARSKSGTDLRQNIGTQRTGNTYRQTSQGNEVEPCVFTTASSPAVQVNLTHTRPSNDKYDPQARGSRPPSVGGHHPLAPPPPPQGGGSSGDMTGAGSRHGYVSTAGDLSSQMSSSSGLSGDPSKSTRDDAKMPGDQFRCDRGSSRSRGEDDPSSAPGKEARNETPTGADPSRRGQEFKGDLPTKETKVVLSDRPRSGGPSTTPSPAPVTPSPHSSVGESVKVPGENLPEGHFKKKYFNEEYQKQMSEQNASATSN